MPSFIWGLVEFSIAPIAHRAFHATRNQIKQSRRILLARIELFANFIEVFLTPIGTNKLLFPNLGIFGQQPLGIFNGFLQDANQR